MIDDARRGFLAGYPDEVVAVFNGTPVTKADILNSKRARQRRRMVWKRRRTELVTRPCHVWVFHVPCFPYMGWWLYARTSRRKYRLRDRRDLILKVMQLFPCGRLPMIELFREWKVAFAEAYSVGAREGRALARATIAPNGDLLDIEEFKDG